MRSIKKVYGMLKEWRNKTGAKMMDLNPKWNGLKYYYKLVLPKSMKMRDINPDFNYLSEI